MFTLYRDYRNYSRDDRPGGWHRLWAIREVIFDYCPRVFQFYYSHLHRK